MAFAYLINIVFLLFGLLLIIRPKMHWQFLKRGDSEGVSRPSGSDLWRIRIGGAICIVMAIVGLYYVLQ